MIARAVSGRIVAAATVLLALTIVNLLALDHTVLRLSADAHEHVQHCHGAPASCANQAVPSGPGQFLYTEPWLRSPDLILAELAGAVDLFSSGFEPVPQPPPPRG